MAPTEIQRPWRCTGFFVLLFLLLTTRFIYADEHADNTCKPVISADKDRNVIFVRPHENAFRICTLTQSRLQGLISGFLKEPENQQADFRSIYIGRLVDHPWLSHYLAVHALAHAGWDRDKGQPRSGYINQLVRDILSAPELISQIQEPFAGSGYTVSGASVEKVLVTKANEIDWLDIHEPVLVPYDALTHFILKKSVLE